MRKSFVGGSLLVYVLLGCTTTPKYSQASLIFGNVVGLWRLIKFDCAEQGKYSGSVTEEIMLKAPAYYHFEINRTGQNHFYALSENSPGLLCAKTVQMKQFMIYDDSTVIIEYDGSKVAYLPSADKCLKGQIDVTDHMEQHRITFDDGNMQLEMLRPSESHSGQCSNGRTRFVLAKSSDQLPLEPKMIDSSEIK